MRAAITPLKGLSGQADVQGNEDGAVSLLVAEMVATPGATAVTSPDAPTDATSVRDDVHTTTRSASAMTLASCVEKMKVVPSCWLIDFIRSRMPSP